MPASPLPNTCRSWLAIAATLGGLHLQTACRAAEETPPADGSPTAGGMAAPRATAPAPAPATAPAPAPAPATDAESGTPTTPAASDHPAHRQGTRDRPSTRKAAPEAQQLDEVEVNGSRLSDMQERRYSTAAKQVYGREELDRFGDSTVADVLKRLPGVTIAGTPGRGGDIRMRGLGNGYTMILLNGEPMPRGFSLDQLAPDQIERIEIFKAPVAEHSTRAIAGTINIVLRENIVRHTDQATPVLGYEGGRVQEQLFLQREDGTPKLQYTLGAHVSHREDAGDSTITTVGRDIQTGATTLAQQERDQSLSVGNSLHANGRLNWKLGGGDTASASLFVLDSHSTTDTHSTLVQTAGTTTPPFASAQAHADASFQLARLMGTLKLGMAEGGRLELRFNLGDSTSNSSTTRDQYDALGNPDHVVFNRADINDQNWSTAGKYSRPVGTGHQLAAGWELEGGRRAETADTLQDGFNPLAAYGDQIRARTQRLAGYAQDEWDITPLWSAYGGVRWEEIRTRASALAVSADNTSVVLNPLLHSVWRFSTDSRDQVRAALTTSYRAPTLGNLSPVPTLSATYPATVANTAASPDSIGNPRLRPELARGLDLAYEHYLGQGGLLSASVFARAISDLIRNVVSLQQVSWSTGPRWVSMPQNFSHASTRGIELEAKLQPAELFEGGSRNLDLRLNYSRYWSNVDGIQGPDNRLDQQPVQTANLGTDYRWPGTPLTLGGNVNWTPGFVVQKSVTQVYVQGSKRVLDVYGLWKFSPLTQLRVNISNALHYDYLTADGQDYGTGQQLAQTVEKTYPTINARLEIKF